MNRELGTIDTTAGYTLIEMMIVVIILAVAAVVVIPKLGGTLRDAKLRAASRELVSVLQLAYSQSVTLSKEHRVRFDSGESRYWLEEREQVERSQRFVPADRFAAARGELAEGIMLRVRSSRQDPGDDPTRGRRLALTAAARDTHTDTIVFRPDGTADGREIELRDTDGFGLLLRIQPSTARVKVTELERERP